MPSNDKATKQQDMFGEPFGTDPKKLARTHDPNTSHIAAHSVDTGRWERRVLEAIRSFGSKGAIQDDVIDWIQAKYGPQKYPTITARFKALQEKRLIIYTKETRKSKSGRPSRVRVAVEFS